MSVKYITSTINSNKEISKGIFRLNIKGNYSPKPGQFYMLKSWKKECLLARPISVHDVDDNGIYFLYQVVGQGTEFLSRLKEGDNIELLGPLGNGFNCNLLKGNIAIITGGIGIAPIKLLLKELSDCKIDLYSGFRDKSYLIDEFENYIAFKHIASESGVCGFKGYVTSIFKPEDYDTVLCCGPEAMMMKVIQMCKNSNVSVYASMEKHMACGLGACLVCTCKTIKGNKRTCVDGPVFLGEEIVIDA